jgi:hypothetical protein
MTEPRTAAGRRAVLKDYVVDALKAEEATRAGNQRTIYGQAEFVASWLVSAPEAVRRAVEAEAASPDSEALRAALERIAYADEFSTLDGSFDRNNIRKYARAALTPGSRG